MKALSTTISRQSSQGVLIPPNDLIPTIDRIVRPSSDGDVMYKGAAVSRLHVRPFATTPSFSPSVIAPKLYRCPDD
ncbi:hypothetical protein J6590_012227 [Homalodisca vitripennis]|nr:hypothetical protein J6590_012227 [Homalodisca vitripennis]